MYEIFLSVSPYYICLTERALHLD